MRNLSEEYRVLFEGGFTIADECLARAIRNIDLRFGQGYAKAHPELVATYMTIAAQEFNTSSSQRRQWELVGNALSRVSAIVNEILERIPEPNESKNNSA